MDGNGRWAKLQGRSVNFGHRAGVRAIKRVMYACDDLGVKVLSIYAFSTENWSRSRREVGGLMRLFEETVQKEFDELHERGIRVHISGRKEGLSQHLVKMLEDAQEMKSRGVDVVIGYFETHSRKDTIAKAEGLESVARKQIAYRGATFEEMDTDAILARHPEVAIVDEVGVAEGIGWHVDINVAQLLRRAGQQGVRLLLHRPEVAVAHQRQPTVAAVA